MLARGMRTGPRGIGLAESVGYGAQTAALGSGATAVVAVAQAVSDGEVQVVPDVSVTGGGGSIERLAATPMRTLGTGGGSGKGDGRSGPTVSERLRARPGINHVEIASDTPDMAGVALGIGLRPWRRRATALVVALVLAPGAANAAPGAIRDARAEIDVITERIERRTAELELTRQALADAGTRLEISAGRLSTVIVLREGIDAQLEAISARLAGAQAQLDEAAAEAFMGVGSPGSGVLDAVLGSASLSEVGDRITYAAAASDRTAAIAREASLARAELERRHAAADLLVGAEAVLVGSVRAARDDQAEAVEASGEAIEALEAERDAAVATLDRLRARTGGLAGVDLSDIGRALHGEDSVTYGRWAGLFLEMVDAPVCRDNLVVVVAWQAAEGTQAAWNPLATTRRMPGSASFNSVGVQSFTSLGQGLRGTWETIRNGWDVYRYGAIVRSLRACAPATATGRAINASSWCPGCTGGMYVLNVMPHVDASLESYLAL